MDRHLSSDLTIASPSLCSILRAAGLLSPMVLKVYELSCCFGGNTELMARPAGQSFNPRIARLCELALQTGKLSEVELCAVILAATELAELEKIVPVQNPELLSPLMISRSYRESPGSAFCQALAIDNLRRAHLLDRHLRAQVIEAAGPTVRAAEAAPVKNPLTPILLKAFSRYNGS